jgi:hypothetical protein
MATKSWEPGSELARAVADLVADDDHALEYVALHPEMLDEGGRCMENDQGHEQKPTA